MSSSIVMEEDDDHPNNDNKSKVLQHVQPNSGTTSSTTSFERNVNSSTATITNDNIKHSRSKLEESDEDVLMVPDVEAAGNATCTSNKKRLRPRGRNPVDKEYRRLKRLLRNRVSAQQARERKKVYVNDLEARAKELHHRNLKLEEKISTLINQNAMLRKVLMNTRPKPDDHSAETNNKD